MKNRIEKSQNKSAESIRVNQSEFDFELWAKQVRPQLLASVQKRGVR